MAQQFRAARCAGCGWHAPRTVFNSLKSPLVVSFRHRGTTATTAAAAADAPAAAGLPPDGPAAAEPLLLDSLRVVLVAPKTAANIGAVARVCGNFEVSEWAKHHAQLHASTSSRRQGRTTPPTASTAPGHGLAT
jgi:hypothetical protein